MAQGFNVNNFRSAINEKDVVRTNKFLMEFTIPTGLLQTRRATENIETARRAEYWCEISNSPALNLLTTEGRRYTYGPLEKRPFSTGYNDLQVTFLEDCQSDNFRLINDWFRMINHSTLNSERRYGNQLMYSYEMNYREDYITDAKLKIYDNKGNIVRSIVFSEMFPINITDTALNWSDVNSILRLNVNFTFLEWYLENDPNPYNPIN